MLETDGERHLFELQVYLDELEPDAVRVELYADGGIGGAGEQPREIARVGQLKKPGRMLQLRGLLHGLPRRYSRLSLPNIPSARAVLTGVQSDYRRAQDLNAN